MSFIIIARNPSNNKIVAITMGEDDEDIATFDTEEDAEDAARDIIMCKVWPYAVVETP